MQPTFFFIYNMKTLISIDWLTFNVNVPFENNDYNYQGNSKYEIVKEDLGTIVFENRYIILHKKDKIATFTCKPKSQMIDKNLGQIQIANKYLYCDELYTICSEIISLLEVTFWTFSRIDICADNQNFVDISDPNIFIKKFASMEIIKLGKTKGFLPFKSKKGLQFSGITFKSKDSIVSWKMYNKSLEMKEVKEKKYIKQLWREFNWDSINDVYRVEVSLKNFTKQQLISKYGTNPFYNLESLLLDCNLADVFYYYLNKSFKFCYNEGKKNISENKKIQIFDPYQSSYKMGKILTAFDESRNTRIMINELFMSIAKARANEVEEIENCLSTLLFLLKKYDLIEYFESKYKINTDILDKYRIDLLTPVSTEIFID